MTNLSTLSAAEAATLEERTQAVCVIYDDHPLPVGSEPARTRLGVESRGARSFLHVDRSVRYTGDDAEIAAWLQRGTRQFTTIDELLAWVRGWHLPDEPRPRSRRPEIGDVAALTEAGAVDVPSTTRPSPDTDTLTTAVTSKVFGQEGAVSVLAEAITHHTRKAFPRRPLTAMLMGPTGSGKTLTAETIADALGDDWTCIRLDMSEFSERHSVSRLIGAPPGYLGYGDESLASRLAANPHLIVVFDEIDKAHPDVVQALMNLMDAGRLDSARHGSVPAKHSILLFTSNLTPTGFDGASSGNDMDRHGRQRLLDAGMPDYLVGRFARVVVFLPLPAEAMATVAAGAVAAVAADYGVTVEHIEPAYLSGLLDRAATSRLGVRSIEHLIDRELGADLSEHPDGAVTVHDEAPRVRTRA